MSFLTRVQKTPVKSKIFGIGLSKTGTTSLYAALHILGFRAGTFRHMKALGLEDWFKGDFTKDYLQEYDAVTDAPLTTMYPELDERYPNSRFILTLRPVESWLVSIEKQFRKSVKRGKLRGGEYNKNVRLMTYGYYVFNESAFRRTHKNHVREVMEYFSDFPEKLLVLNLFDGQGWTELCDFLDMPARTDEFPNVKPGYRLKK